MNRLTILSILLVAGCGDTGKPPVTPASSAATPKAIDLVDVSFAGLERAVADEKGKVVLVDVWATWCVPCMKEFPHLVAFHEKFAGQGLACISVSTDDEKTRTKALDFLKIQKAHFGNYRLNESNDKITKELNEKFPTDSQPVLFLFNRRGEKVMTLWSKEERQTEFIEKQIQKLLAE